MSERTSPSNASLDSHCWTHSATTSGGALKFLAVKDSPAKLTFTGPNRPAVGKTDGRPFSY